MLDAIEELRIMAMGPGEYITRLRYQVGLKSLMANSNFDLDGRSRSNLGIRQPLQNMAIVIALEMGLVQAIVRNGGHTITAWELAAMASQEKLLVGRSSAKVDPHSAGTVSWSLGHSLLLTH